MALLPGTHCHAKTAVLVIFTAFAGPAGSDAAAQDSNPAKSRDEVILECMITGTSTKDCVDYKPYKFDAKYGTSEKWVFHFDNAPLFTWPTLKGAVAADLFLEQQKKSHENTLPPVQRAM